MAQIMNDTQRAKALEEYNPKEHLIAVGKDKQTGKSVLYYPAAWRLYELHLRYPNANFKSEIIFHDEQKGTVIVKAYLYLGKDYAESDKKAESMKQGNIVSLDKVETAAKARCARDFGIGTEYALDMTADETDAMHDTLQNATKASPQPASNGKGNITPLPVKPSEVEQVRVYVGKVWNFKSEDFDTRWNTYKVHVLGKPVEDVSLTREGLNTLRNYSVNEENKRAVAAK